MKNAKGMDGKLIKRFRAEYAQNPANEALRIALSGSALAEAAYDDNAAARTDYTFAIDIKTMEPTNQRSSGRCWLFSALHVLRERVAIKCNLKSFELSENYLAFWDKFEKINYFLESVIDLADRPADDRTLQHILNGALNDGGQWDMMVSLVKKYGVVPIAAMSETHSSGNTRTILSMLNLKMRMFAAELKELAQKGEDVRARKEEMMEEIFRALVLVFGLPPETIDFEYVDGDEVYHVDRDLTPLAFYEKYVGLDFEDYVSLINAPTADKPYYQTYTVKYLGNVVGGRPIKYLNVPMEELKELILNQLKDGEVVWFGSDVSKFGNRESGLWDLGAHGYGKLFQMDFDMSKEQALDYRDSAMNHAMVITGVNFGKDGQPDRWKIQNSWGTEKAHKGYYVMGGPWFDRYVYQAVIHKKYLGKELLRALEGDMKELEPWDPMGTLA